MTTITIPQKLSKNSKDLIAIPRDIYEGFLACQKIMKFREIELTSSQKRLLKKSRENLAKGNYLTIHELGRKLGIKN
jgi:hypothetical protein